MFGIFLVTRDAIEQRHVKRAKKKAISIAKNRARRPSCAFPLAGSVGDPEFDSFYFVSTSD